MPIPTPHIAAKAGDFAKTVFMPGDPLRAKFIAEKYFDNPVLINEVRGMLGYTGTYRGKPVSVMGSGMGMPSMGIYSFELFNFYEVENIVRIGSAGSIAPGLKLGDIVLGLGACTDSRYAEDFRLPGYFAPIASYPLVKAAQASADKLGIGVTAGNLLSTDIFYYDDMKATLQAWEKMGVLAVEMESAALYMNAARAGKNALCICTVSDLILSGKALTADERQYSFTQMMELALGML
jgi:purine-nucleoside phosphorylase